MILEQCHFDAEVTAQCAVHVMETNTENQELRLNVEEVRETHQAVTF